MTRIIFWEIDDTLAPQYNQRSAQREGKKNYSFPLDTNFKTKYVGALIILEMFPESRTWSLAYSS